MSAALSGSAQGVQEWHVYTVSVCSSAEDVSRFNRDLLLDTHRATLLLRASRLSVVRALSVPTLEHDKKPVEALRNQSLQGRMWIDYDPQDEGVAELRHARVPSPHGPEHFPVVESRLGLNKGSLIIDSSTRTIANLPPASSAQFYDLSSHAMLPMPEPLSEDTPAIELTKPAGEHIYTGSFVIASILLTQPV